MKSTRCWTQRHIRGIFDSQVWITFSATIYHVMGSFRTRERNIAVATPVGAKPVGRADRPSEQICAHFVVHGSTTGCIVVEASMRSGSNSVNTKELGPNLMSHVFLYCDTGHILANGHACRNEGSVRTPFLQACLHSSREGEIFCR